MEVCYLPILKSHQPPITWRGTEIFRLNNEESCFENLTNNLHVLIQHNKGTRAILDRG